MSKERASNRPWPRRVLALVILVTFLLASMVTTVISLGDYCLTSDGGNTAALPCAR